MTTARPVYTSIICSATAFALLALGGQVASAQIDNPQAFFDQMFGGQNQAVEKELAKVAISFDEENDAGEKMLQSYLNNLESQNIKVTSRGKDVAYLRRLVETLRPSLTNAKRYRRISVYLADSPETDARSFPGGRLVFFRGLLDIAGNEAALVGVIGHELSHLDHGHQLLNLRRMKLAQKTFGTDGADFSPQRFLVAGRMMSQMWAAPFRPQDESAADADGATWAYQAGYDPREMAKLFLKLHERDKDQPQNNWTGLFRTHPFHIDRYKAILARFDELQQATPKPDLYIGAENLKRRATREQNEFSE